MKKLCPNLDRDGGLETVLEVPVPEEIFRKFSGSNRAWRNMKSWMKPNIESSYPSPSHSSLFGGRNIEMQLLLGVAGAPLLPFPISYDKQQPITTNSIKGQNIEASMAKYIVKQYLAAVGGESKLESVESMYAMGQVKISASEFSGGEGNEGVKMKKAEIGGFVLWQKKPELWCLEMMVSGYKISAGSDGNVTWRQTPWHHAHASTGQPRPLRRLFQGIDPRSTANLFNNSICIGEKTVKNEQCFTLKLEAEPSSLQARNSNNVDIIQHTVWGYFSTKTGLLVQFEDSYWFKLKSPTGSDTIFWETKVESLIQDYREVDGIHIAHAGNTCVSLSRFGEGPESHSRTRMEETWKIEEVDFNIKGLSMDCFLGPSDFKRDEEKGVVEFGVVTNNAQLLPYKTWSSSLKISASKVVAINVDDSSESESHEN
ncbi:hypothetical protein Lal_00048162 [Lupinus albus]|uniref:Uncharacterized protein n=1 Tax=Lupinus albus TaxID=3870 RepID=A0A6A4QN00_LUPAL|nr:hypothetical protein Lalb_Chr04g0250891 [Lupinus albus]KAF1868883.1 hypothetical protein Lal_00048162 [Lupinus albus]